MSSELRVLQVVFTTERFEHTGMESDEISDRIAEVVENAVVAAYEHGGLKDVLRCRPDVF